MGMNRNGQTLIIFVILIPIILLLAAFIVDLGIVAFENTKLKNTTKLIIKEVFEDKSEDKIIDLMKKNKIPVDNLKITTDTNHIKIENKYTVKSIFGNLVNIKEYKIETKIKGYKKNNKLVIIAE